jgi:hypothetical protein
MNEKRTIFEVGATTTLLVDKLQAVEGYISYNELSDAAGANVQKKGRGSLTSARRIMQRDHGKLFLTVRGEGLRVANEYDAKAIATHSIRKTHSEMRRGMKRIQTLDIGKLDNEERKEVFAGQSLMGAVYLMSQRKSVTKLIDRCAEANKELAFSETLKEFGVEKESVS